MEQTRRSRKKDNTHRALMHSAKMLFEKHGIGNVTIDQISEGADVSRSTFFSHFTSIDDLLSQIADEEVNDLFAAAGEGNIPTVNQIFSRLARDTYPYPYLVCELFTRRILSDDPSSVARVDELIRREIEQGGFGKLQEQFSSKDISAFIFGAYFGLVFQKLINREPFDDPAETNDKITNLIQFFKNQEEQDHE